MTLESRELGAPQRFSFFQPVFQFRHRVRIERIDAHPRIELRMALHQRASPGGGIYDGVLGGVEGMVKSFAAELRPVRVNGMCAGAVDTELWHRLPEAERLATFARIAARLPVGRVGKPEDIAEAYLYLMKTGFSTGETIVVDGGSLQAPSSDRGKRAYAMLEHRRAAQRPGVIADSCRRAFAKKPTSNGCARR
jgi:Enoyl-(Acyl carrier protein) reductase